MGEENVECKNKNNFHEDAKVHLPTRPATFSISSPTTRRRTDQEQKRETRCLSLAKNERSLGLAAVAE